MFMAAEEDNLPLNLEALKDTRLLYRDEEVRQLVLSMSTGVSTYVFGSVGTGKTSAVKLTLEKLLHSKIRALYISCRSRETEHGILTEIITQINANFPQKIYRNTGSNDDLRSILENYREKFPAFKLIVLDNLESLKQPRVIDRLLLDLKFTVVLISDVQKAIDKVSALARSYIVNTIEFKDYTPEQVVSILSSKASVLVGKESCKESVLAKIAKLCDGNIAHGQTLLITSALRAAASKKRCIDDCDVPEVRIAEELNDDEKIIMDILNELYGLPGGQLYKMYCERTKFPKSERTFRDYMQDLVRKNKVRARGSNKGRVYETIGTDS
jgi:Cdc6-like AAA superfamily ATPase